MTDKNKINSYYDTMRDELEKEKFNSAIQLSNAKQQAMKSSQATLNAQGYGTQGYGASQQTNINNSYLNTRNADDSSYWNKLTEINKNENDELADNYTDNFNSFLESDVTNSALTKEQYAENGVKYGLFIKTGNGYEINKDGEAFKNLETAQQNTLIEKYDNFIEDKDAIMASYADDVIKDSKTSAGYPNISSLYGYKMGSGYDAGDFNHGVKYELEYVSKNISDIPDGTMLTMTHSARKGNRFNVLIKGGKYYVVSDAQYNSYKGRKAQAYKDKIEYKN